MSDSDISSAYDVTADEFRQFVERYEQFDAEEADIKDQKKELKAELKGRGYDTAAFMTIIALRKKDPDDVAEHEAIIEIYKSALGME